MDLAHEESPPSLHKPCGLQLGEFQCILKTQMAFTELSSSQKHRAVLTTTVETLKIAIIA